MRNTPARRADAIAVQVNELHAEFLGAARRTLDIGIKIGGLLALKKEGLGHGAWLPWCEKYLRFSDRTARNYLRLWTHREDLKLASNASMAEAYKLLDTGRRIGSTPNVPALRPALPVRVIRHGLATGLHRLASWIDAR